MKKEDILKRICKLEHQIDTVYEWIGGELHDTDFIKSKYEEAEELGLERHNLLDMITPTTGRMTNKEKSIQDWTMVNQKLEADLERLYAERAVVKTEADIDEANSHIHELWDIMSAHSNSHPSLWQYHLYHAIDDLSDYDRAVEDDLTKGRYFKTKEL